MIISKINIRVSKKTHKFVIEVPNSIKHAKLLYLKNGYTIWCYGIANKKYNIFVAFKILENNESSPPGCTKSIGHWMFDVEI